MRIFVLFVLCLLSVPSWGTTYTIDATSESLSKSSNAAPFNTYAWGAAIIKAADGSVVTTISLGTLDYSQTKTCSWGAQNYSYPFYLVVFCAPSASYTQAQAGSGVFIRWVAPYVGTGVNQQGGFTGTQAVDVSGNPVDPSTGVTKDPTDYEQSIISAKETPTIRPVAGRR